MSSNLLVTLNLTQEVLNALERYLDEHVMKIGDLNCLLADSLSSDTIYLCDGANVVKVVNIGKS